MKGHFLSGILDWWQGEVSSTFLFYFLFFLFLFVISIFLLALLLIKRKGRRSDIENVLRGTEELLRGNFSWRVSTESRGAIFKIASNINLLASDFKARTSEIESARDHYYHLVESLQDYALVATNRELEIISFNKAAVNLFGWSAEEVKGKSSSIIFSEAFWLALLPAIAREELKSVSHRYKSEFRKKNGEHFQAQATIDPLRTRGGEVSGYLIVIREASEDIHFEQELKESEERYRSLVELLGEGIAFIQEEKIIYANKQFSEMLGASSEELQGRSLKDFIIAEDLLFALDEFRKIEQHEGMTKRISLRLHDVNKLNILEVLLTGTSVSLHGKKGLICALMDVTESKRAERVIRRSENLLDTTLDSVSEGLMLLHYSPRGAISTLSNRSFEKIFNARSEEIIGRPFLLAQEKMARLIKDESAFLKRTGEWIENKESEESVLFEMKGKENRILECFTTPVCEREGEITGRLMAFRDVTGQKEFEEDLRGNVQELKKSKEAIEKAYLELNRVNQELQMRTEQLDKLNQDLRILDEMKTKLLANVSHELQTPLVSIKGYTEMILKGKLGAITDEQERGLQISLKNIERLIKMIDNLLQFSRAEKEPGKTDLQVFAVWELIDETIELVRKNKEAQHISITTQYHTDELQVEADREKIAQVFINLLSNAIKFNKPNGNVSVIVRKGEPGYLLIDISDTGIGISQEYIEKIFKRYFRAEDPFRKIEGTGLGLSIVKDILDQHQCHIDVQSKIGEGTTISFTLPMPSSSLSHGHSQISPDEKSGIPEEKTSRFPEMNSKGPPSNREGGWTQIKIIKKTPQNESL